MKYGKSYYDHYLTQIEKGNLIDFINQSDSQERDFKPMGSESTPSYESFGGKDTKLMEILQTKRQENVLFSQRKKNKRRMVFNINSIRNVFPKDNSEWLNWINQGKALFLDKGKIQTLIDQQRTNLVDVDYLDLDFVAKVINDFENPTVEDDDLTNDNEKAQFSLRKMDGSKKKGIGYKVFVLKDRKLYPPMVANPNGAATPVGVWLDADAAPIAGESKTEIPQVKQGGKGTQGESGKS